VAVNKVDGHFSVGNWHISAEMDATKPGLVKAWNAEKTAVIVSSGIFESKGKKYQGKEKEAAKLMEVVDGKPILQEVSDEFPSSIKRVHLMNLTVGNQKK
jgi:hypothetical protein